MPTRKRKLDGNDCNYCGNHLKPGQPPVKMRNHTNNCLKRKKAHIENCKKCLLTDELSTKAKEKMKLRRKTKYEGVEVEPVESEAVQLEALTPGKA